MIQIALYKGQGEAGNALVRWWKRSPYSHCELVIAGVCYSSSVKDKGVRRKTIDLDPEKWDLIDLPWADGEQALAYFATTKGQPYSWASLIWAQVFGREYDEPKAAFCSEWCAAALGLPTPAIHSPESLGRLCEFIGRERA